LQIQDADRGTFSSSAKLKDHNPIIYSSSAPLFLFLLHVRIRLIITCIIKNFIGGCSATIRFGREGFTLGSSRFEKM
jgi:hypothetical protein